MTEEVEVSWADAVELVEHLLNEAKKTNPDDSFVCSVRIDNVANRYYVCLSIGGSPVDYSANADGEITKVT